MLPVSHNGMNGLISCTAFFFFVYSFNFFFSFILSRQRLCVCRRKKKKKHLPAQSIQKGGSFCLFFFSFVRNFLPSVLFLFLMFFFLYFLSSFFFSDTAGNNYCYTGTCLQDGRTFSLILIWFQPWSMKLTEVSRLLEIFGR